MVITVARIVLHLPGARSLKDKRQVVRSLIAQVQRLFQVTAAEVDRLQQWQTAVIGMACVSNDVAHGEAVLAKAVDFAEARFPEAQVVQYETDVFHVFERIRER